MIGTKIIGRFIKMNSGRYINQYCSASCISIRQRYYYEHIMRNNRALNLINEYIIENLQNWRYDSENAIM